MGLRKVALQGSSESVSPSAAPGAPSRAIFDDSASGAISDCSGPSRGLDRPLAVALRCRAISRARVDDFSRAASASDAALSWRQYVLAFPDDGETLFRLAAEIYGFRSVTVCQIGTLIYNTKLVDYFSTADWNRLFDRGIVPVIEYGTYPDIVRNHLLAAADPGSRHVRSLIPELPLSRTELVFVPKRGILELQMLLGTQVAALRVNPFVAQRVQAAEQALLSGGADVGEAVCAPMTLASESWNASKEESGAKRQAA